MEQRAMPTQSGQNGCDRGILEGVIDDYFRGSIDHEQLKTRLAEEILNRRPVLSS